MDQPRVVPRTVRRATHQGRGTPHATAPPSLRRRVSRRGCVQRLDARRRVAKLRRHPLQRRREPLVLVEQLRDLANRELVDRARAQEAEHWRRAEVGQRRHRLRRAGAGAPGGARLACRALTTATRTCRLHSCDAHGQAAFVRRARGSGATRRRWRSHLRQQLDARAAPLCATPPRDGEGERDASLAAQPHCGVARRKLRYTARGARGGCRCCRRRAGAVWITPPRGGHAGTVGRALLGVGGAATLRVCARCAPPCFPHLCAHAPLAAPIASGALRSL